jgi:hypothetical protein
MIAIALAVTALTAPVATVHACSCMAFSTAEAVEAADLAFVGTVTDAAPGGKDPAMGMALIRYAFEIERASEQVGPMMEVVSHDDPGGASCGFAFGVGERWFVASASEGGLLRTNLCSGNRLVDELSPAEADELVSLLPVEPVAQSPDPQSTPESPAGSGVDGAVLVAVLVGLAAAAALAAVLVVGYRRGRAS